MILYFDQPALLAIGLIVAPLIVTGWRLLSNLDPLRRVVVLGLRSILILALVVALAGPRLVDEHDRMTVIGVLDLSGSVKRFAEIPAAPDGATRSTVEYLREWFRTATRTKAPDDRFGLVVFDGQATVVSVPVRGDYVDDNLDVSVMPGTNIAEAIRLALAMFPAGEARRMVLVSDGNETAGSALEVARQAAAGAGVRSGVPIDVVPITYEVRGDVQIARLEVPPNAQAGQTVTARIVLEATRPTRGRLTLLREGVAEDLAPGRPGQAREIDVPAGRSVHLAQVVLGQTPINRFEAIFEASDPAADILELNNRAESFTATPSRGLVLVVDTSADDRPNLLASALDEAGIAVETVAPRGVPADLLSFQRYDLIVLDNVAAFALEPSQHELIGRWVHDFGGGLVMVGGEQGFGAGGWNGTTLEAVLPVELDPPRELQLASAALVLVLDKSGSMAAPVAGARATQQSIANEAAAMAIESLRSESLVGVVTFDFGARELVPLQPNDNPRAIAQTVRTINPDGGTNLAPALRMAQRMLAGVKAQKKLVVCLSDGQSSDRDLEGIVNGMAASDIKLTTIAIGDDADHKTLKALSELAGGEFYAVLNPRVLPRVLVDSVQVINKPLLKEVPFTPQVRATGSILSAGMGEAPLLDGLVITTARPDPQVTVELTHPEGEPLLVHWQVGLGRVAAFTSDTGDRWARRWVGWPGYGRFWTQLARTMSRPAVSADTELLVSVDDGRLSIVLEAAGDTEGFMDYLDVEGDVYAPGGRIPVKLRQTAPGRYETELSALDPGNYIVALNPRRGSRRLSPVIGGASQLSSVEFRRFDADAALLDRVVEVTGGRRLDLAEPGAMELFDRRGLPLSRSAVAAWHIVLWIALALVLADVASRRLAWSAAMIRGALARALARVRPAHVRGQEAAATLASLRRINARVEERLDAQRSNTSVEPTIEAPAPRRPVPAEPPAPTTQRIADAISAFLGRPRGAAAPEKKATSAEPTPKREPASPTTGSLLAAKKRARDRLG